VTITPQTYVFEIKRVLRAAQAKAYTAINSAVVEAYWLVGKRIVEEELVAEIERQKEILKVQAECNFLILPVEKVVR